MQTTITNKTLSPPDDKRSWLIDKLSAWVGASPHRQGCLIQGDDNVCNCGKSDLMREAKETKNASA